ncbi:MAG: hypothetical protein ACOH1T_03125 [Microbacteriaceae bacterium]
MTPDEPPLPEDLPELFAELMRRLQVENETLDREIEESAAEDAEREAEHAEKARSGELGPEWAKVQRRIDLNQTTLEAVFSGEDTSTEAAKLRDLSQRNLGELRALWEDQAQNDDPEEEPTPLEVLNVLSAESRERHDAAAQRIAAILDQSGLNEFKEQP